MNTSNNNYRKLPSRILTQITCGSVCSLCTLILLATIVLLSVACSDDSDGTSLPYIYDFVTVKTGADKNILNVTTDDGKVWSTSTTVSTSVKDSVFRCICAYTDDAGKMSIHYLKSAFSPLPKEAGLYKSHPTDPLKIVSLWNSGGYLNMHLGIMTTDKDTHAFGFLQDSIVGGKAFVTLLHEQPKNDPESYTQDVYLSMPLMKYADHDSVILRIKTYEGPGRWAFALR